MCNEIISENEALLENDKPALNSNDITFFKHAPVMSKEVSHVIR
jgi:hypothetical protein